MRALTIRQPWASLIAHGIKTIETRVWHTNYRGPLAIHAGLNMADHWRIWHAGHQRPGSTEAAVVTALLDLDLDLDPLDGDDILPNGAIIAVARLADCLPIHHLGEECAVRRIESDGGSLWLSEPEEDGAPGEEDTRDIIDQLPLGDYQPGRYAWLLDDIRMLPAPVPAKGRQGLWTPDARIVAQLGLEATA